MKSTQIAGEVTVCGRSQLANLNVKNVGNDSVVLRFGSSWWSSRETWGRLKGLHFPVSSVTFQTAHLSVGSLNFSLTLFRKGSMQYRKRKRLNGDLLEWRRSWLPYGRAMRSCVRQAICSSHPSPYKMRSTFPGKISVCGVSRSKILKYSSVW